MRGGVFRRLRRTSRYGVFWSGVFSPSLRRTYLPIAVRAPPPVSPDPVAVRAPPPVSPDPVAVRVPTPVHPCSPGAPLPARDPYPPGDNQGRIGGKPDSRATRPRD